MKYFLLFACLFIISLQAQAGYLNSVHIGCGSCGNNAYLLDWGGSWSRPQLLLEYRPAWSSQYIYYAGNLPHSGVDSSPVYNAFYRMKSCQGQNCYAEAAAFVPYVACRPVR